VLLAALAAACWASRLSGGKEVWRRGWADDALAIDGLRLMCPPPGKARVGRWRGRARGEGPGGEVAAEPGGEAMVEWCCYCEMLMLCGGGIGKARR